MGTHRIEKAQVARLIYDNGCYKSIIMGQLDKQLVKGNVKNTPTKMNIDKALVPNNERKSSCFIYQGLQCAHDFPNKVELNALQVYEVEAEEERYWEEKIITRINLYVIGIISEHYSMNNIWLMYIESFVKCHKLVIMIDSGPSLNLLSLRVS